VAHYPGRVYRSYDLYEHGKNLATGNWQLATGDDNDNGDDYGDDYGETL